jgi:hypothetical protein
VKNRLTWKNEWVASVRILQLLKYSNKLILKTPSLASDSGAVTSGFGKFDCSVSGCVSRLG